MIFDFYFSTAIKGLSYFWIYLHLVSTFKSFDSLSSAFDLKMTMVTMQVNDKSGEAKFVSSIEEKKQEQYCNSLECISDGIQIWMFFRCVRESALAAAIKHLPEGWGLSQSIYRVQYNLPFITRLNSDLGMWWWSCDDGDDMIMLSSLSMIGCEYNCSKNQGVLFFAGNKCRSGIPSE